VVEEADMKTWDPVLAALVPSVRACDLQHRDLAALVTEVVAVCDLPVHVDAGGGYDDDAAVGIARLLEQAGASADPILQAAPLYQLYLGLDRYLTKSGRVS